MRSSSIMKSLLRLFVCAVLIGTPAFCCAAESSEKWELADGGSIEGKVMALRGSMVQMETENGRKLISISRFSEAARTAIQEKFPSTVSEVRTAGSKSPPADTSSEGARQQASVQAKAVKTEAESAPPPSPQALPKHPGLRTLKAGDMAPPLRLRKFGSDDTITLESLRGRLVLLIFWNSSEPYAVSEVQYLAAVQRTLPPEIVTIVGVSVDPRWRTYNAAARQFGAHWPSHHDPARAVLRHWGVTAVPTTVVISPDGRIVREHIFGSELAKLLHEMDLLPRQ